MRYAVVYTKGGVGKTTTAVHLATALAQKHDSILLIDGDVQCSASTWASWRRDVTLPRGRKSPVTTHLRTKAIYDEGQHLCPKFEHTVIHAGGRDSAGLRNALLLAERVIVPMGGSGFDAANLEEFKELVEQARTFNPALQAKALINRVDPRGADAQDLRDFLGRRQMPYFKTVIGNRRVYARATSDGMTVEEYRPKVAAATYEMSKLYTELMEWD